MVAPRDEPRCSDCRFFALEELDSYCAHPVVFDQTGFGQEVLVMRAPGGLCAGGKLFRAKPERRGD